MGKHKHWGLGIGDWGLGIGPIPNPQSPIPNTYSNFNSNLIIFLFISSSFNKA